MKMKKHFRCLLLSVYLLVPLPAMGTTTAVPSAGLTATSYVVGAAGVTEAGVNAERSLWNRRILGFLGVLVLTVDPPSATYHDGKTILTYPDNLLAFDQVAYHGYWSTDPTASQPPIVPSGFFDDDFSFPILGPSSLLDTPLVSSGNGLLTIEWNSPSGITVPTADHVNMFSVLFMNVSGKFLQLGIVDPLDANLRQEFAQQYLHCTPPGETTPIACGGDSQALSIGFEVTEVPEPATLSLILAGLLVVLFRRWR